MSIAGAAPIQTDSRILDTVRRYWGFDQLRPLQLEAINATLAARDSLVVMPTGGGKSLCYQVPPAIANRTDVVVSPLISLMKDQVDGLAACGYPAVALHSGMSPDEIRTAERMIASRECRLVFAAPERVVTPGFQRLIAGAGVAAFAIDEAHCISHWGHDFRPEYRQLAQIRDRFPNASVHAFTATATERVRHDIIKQLNLRQPEVLIGSFDRPNLTYRVIQRIDLYEQVFDVINRHAGEAVIVYCLSRKDTESLAEHLRAGGVRAAHYHAGMDPAERRNTHDAFSSERLDVVVATVAFGMGIDRSDVRCVVHAAMPKSLEHYQQETGRAGRDGLEAECVLFYSPADALRLERLIEKSAAEAEAGPEITDAAFALLGRMRGYCTSATCRHRALSEYFGQAFERDDCGACDVCLGEVDAAIDATITAQKILSCVARTESRFGVTHIVEVLRGSASERVQRFGHDQLSTYGLLREMDKKTLTNTVYQLVDQGMLNRAGVERPVLQLNDTSWDVMRGNRKVFLLAPKSEPVRKSRADQQSWEGVDRELFDELRALRRGIAEERSVPPYVIFSDATLRDMARLRPTSLASFARVHGVGAKKTADLGTTFIECVAAACAKRDLTTDNVSTAPPPPRPPARKKGPSASARAAFQLFSDGAGLEEVCETLGRARGTATKYLLEYIDHEQPQTIENWVDNETYDRVSKLARQLGTRYMRPIRDDLDGEVDYDTIRVVIAHLQMLEKKGGK